MELGWITNEAKETLSRGYLLDGETIEDAIKRISEVDTSISIYINEAITRNWLCPSSPIWSNRGTKRGLPLSCNSLHLPDDVSGIFKKNHELAMMSKYGAGVGIYAGDIRARGFAISGGGKSEGVIPWLKCLETTANSVAQGGVRRGAVATYLPIKHGDYSEFLHLRKATGDHNMRARNMNIAACIDDKFMNEIQNGNPEYRTLWVNTLKERVESGEPYMFFSDNVNNNAPQCYKDKGLRIVTSNICNEIYQFTDKDHTFVCCLASLNLARFEEWKDFRFGNGMTLPELSTWFLDAVMQEYIDKAQNIEGLEPAVRSAIKGRALGLGVLGWHTLLQSKMIPIDSFEAFMLNSTIFKFIDDESFKASKDMALVKGEPEWCVGHGIRNTHRTALAPTATNSIISGGVSAGIEPINANAFALKSAKGTFIRKNPILESLLTNKGINNIEIWSKIISDNGSVQTLKELSSEEKSVFLTAREINQHVLIKQAAQRQRWVDNGQSLNLFFASNASAKYIHEVHFEAWKQGLKGLYYLRSESILGGSGNDYKSVDDCLACQG